MKMTPELLHALTPDELPKYRQRTLGLLRRYFHSSIEVGRLPSLLGREFFRAKVTSYRITSFEDAVIFVHDIERCLERLDRVSQDVLAKIVFQSFDYFEAADASRCTWRTIANRFPRALDDLGRIFLEVGVLSPFLCQGVKNEQIAATACNESK
jgi:hypothetical protein